VAQWPLRLTVGNARHEATVNAVAKDRYLIVLGNERIEIAVEELQCDSIRFTAQGIQQTARFVLQGGTVHLDLNGLVAAVSETTHEAGSAERQAGSARLLAPMNGAIISVLAKAGDRVAKGQRIVVLEAMKMQHEISAEREGTIARILVNPGDQVATRQLLAELVPEERKETTS
jgi:geranyl-CoA carboxylase alpha subunit